MAKKGLPPEGINALMAAWDDDNEMILNQDKKKREQANNYTELPRKM